MGDDVTSIGDVRVAIARILDELADGPLSVPDTPSAERVRTAHGAAVAAARALLARPGGTIKPQDPPHPV